MADVLEQVRSWAHRPVSAGSAQERAAWLLGLRQLIDATEAAFAQTLATFDAHGDGTALHGAHSTSSWLQGALHLAAGDANERVAIARGSRSHLRQPMAALAEGAVTYDQVRAVERSVRHLPRETVDEAVSLLTDLAKCTDAGRVRVAGRALRHTVDPDGALTDAQANFQRRHLQLSPLLDGMVWLEALLDTEAAAVLSTSLAPFLVPTGSDDVRTSAQRRADALIEVAHTAITSGALPMQSGSLTQLQVLVPVETLNGRGSAPAQVVDGPGGNDLIPSLVVERLACDATVSRILLDSASIPLDVGRGQRLFSPAQRRALAIRDAGCRFPLCNRPARYTDAHHIVSWAKGGTTDLHNGLLLCRYHHRVVHEGEWRITANDPAVQANGSLMFHGPQEMLLPSHPRGP